ncbi:MAG TPA: branched-chain amino acid ABC transporter permease [Mycobacteriales bacterium]|jgi:branched-chain amino acid transport system permease protein|nr:branched-chain amino acid ABC transporter permease [Mycobacteriales bacterium]
MRQVVVDQLTQASIYALVGVGFVVVFRATRLVNFAQGSIVLVGGLLGVDVGQRLGGNVVESLLVLLIVAGVLGAALYLLLLRPMLGADHLTLLMASIAISSILGGVADLIWGVNTRYSSLRFPGGAIHIPGGVRYSWTSLCIVGVALVIIAGVGAMIRWTRVGLATQAASHSSVLATYRGVRVNAICALMWGVAAATGAVAGVLYSIQSGVDQSTVSLLGFGVFPAIIVGGLDSIAGVVLGSLILAEIQGVVVFYIGADASVPIGYAILLLFLLIRPTGIFGKQEIVRV